MRWVAAAACGTKNKGKAHAPIGHTHLNTNNNEERLLGDGRRGNVDKVACVARARVRVSETLRESVWVVLWSEQSCECTPWCVVRVRDEFAKAHHLDTRHRSCRMSSMTCKLPRFRRYSVSTSPLKTLRQFLCFSSRTFHTSARTMPAASYESQGA